MGTRQKKNRSIGSHVESLETRTLLSSYGIDKYFGNNGVATIQYQLDNRETSTAVATLPDGRIYETAIVGAGTPTGVVVGLARLNFNGQVDPTFGNGGIVTTSLGNDANSPNSIVIQSDGKIVVGAGTYSDMALIRYNTDGSLDTTFGNGGIVTFDLGYDESLSKLLLQPDGEILAIGNSYNGNHNRGIVARFTSNGSLDGGWGGSGYIMSDIGQQVTGQLSSTLFNSGLLLPDGRVLVSGMVGNRPLLERFNSDGSLDATFGGGGIEAPTQIGGVGFNTMSGVALAPDGGYYGIVTSFPGMAGLSKWTSSGAVDTTWGTNGIVTFGQSTSVDPTPLQGSVLVQPDQSVLVAVDYSRAAANALPGVQLCTIAPDGKSIPYSFFQIVGNNYSDTSEVALQPDGRALIAISNNPSPNPPPTGGAFLMRFRTMADPPEGVRLEGSILTVLGENAPSTVNISLVGSNYSVTLDGNTELFPTAVVTQIDVRMLGNGNSVTSGSGVPLNLVDMGYGDLNTAEIDGSSLYLINAGLGSDRINLPAPTDGSGQSIVEGSGDTLNLTGTDGNDDFNVGPTVITSPGRQLTYSSIANINIVTDNGDDTAEITTTTPAVTITGGNGNDTFSVVGGATDMDIVNAGTGTTHLIATATPGAMLLFDNSKASSSSVKVTPGTSTSQSFTLDDQDVTTADRYSLWFGSTPALSNLELDGGPAGDTYTMARNAVGVPTVINAGTGPVKYLAASVPLLVSSDVTFNGSGSPSDSATLGDSANTDGLWHGYTIGGGKILLDGVPGFQYSKIGTLNFTTNNVGSFTNVLDAAGMSVLNVTGGTGSNVFETSPPSSGLGMTARSTVNFNGSAGGPNTFIVTPDPNATYNLTGAGYRDALHVNFTANSGAALHTTGVGSGQYTFTSLQPINFTGIGSLNDLPSLTGPAAQFKSSAPQSLTYVFSSDVGSSIKASSLVLTNTSTNTVIPTSDIALSYNSSTFTATFTFPGFAGGVLPGGNYLASIPAGSISNSAHHALAVDDDLSFTAPPRRVVSQFIFYNGSYYDGNLPAPNSSDSSAIATDKFALLPGQTATFANYTSYDRGINGLMVDAVGLLNNQAITASDFTFRVGNNSSPDTWATAPAPSQIVVEPGKGNGGSDRIEILWPDRAIADEWLQVTVLPTANTGFASPYVFYFGNAIGETGNSRTDAYVDGSDYAAVRDNPRGFLNRAPITDPYDFNKDSFVDGTDLAIARDNTTNFLTVLKLITAPATPVSSPTIVLANSGTSTLIAVPAGPTGSTSPTHTSGASQLSRISTMTIASERQYLISLPQTPAVLRRELLIAQRAVHQGLSPLTASGLGQGLSRLTDQLLK